MFETFKAAIGPVFDNSSGLQSCQTENEFKSQLLHNLQSCSNLPELNTFALELSLLCDRNNNENHSLYIISESLKRAPVIMLNHQTTTHSKSYDQSFEPAAPQDHSSLEDEVTGNDPKELPFEAITAYMMGTEALTWLMKKLTKSVNRKMQDLQRKMKESYLTGCEVCSLTNDQLSELVLFGLGTPKGLNALEVILRSDIVEKFILRIIELYVPQTMSPKKDQGALKMLNNFFAGKKMSEGTSSVVFNENELNGAAIQVILSATTVMQEAEIEALIDFLLWNGSTGNNCSLSKHLVELFVVSKQRRWQDERVAILKDRLSHCIDTINIELSMIGDMPDADKMKVSLEAEVKSLETVTNIQSYHSDHDTQHINEVISDISRLSNLTHDKIFLVMHIAQIDKISHELTRLNHQMRTEWDDQIVRILNEATRDVEFNLSRINDQSSELRLGIENLAVCDGLPHLEKKNVKLLTKISSLNARRNHLIEELSEVDGMLEETVRLHSTVVVKIDELHSSNPHHQSVKNFDTRLLALQNQGEYQNEIFTKIAILQSQANYSNDDVEDEEETANINMEMSHHMIMTCIPGSQATTDGEPGFEEQIREVVHSMREVELKRFTLMSRVILILATLVQRHRQKIREISETIVSTDPESDEKTEPDVILKRVESFGSLHDLKQSERLYYDNLVTVHLMIEKGVAELSTIIGEVTSSVLKKTASSDENITVESATFQYFTSLVDPDLLSLEALPSNMESIRDIVQKTMNALDPTLLEPLITEELVES
eukprot:GHVH01000110.1.p1 GENE.GHVH01000110.1~~GHVH01000110.1.p1  ORF type:complete len:774 (+),score=134.72 GHVH01000110.1:52-2373(+)